IQRKPGRYTELRTHRLPFCGSSPEEPEAAEDSLDDVLLPGLATVPCRAQVIATGGELSIGLEVQLTRGDPHPDRLLQPGDDLEREHGVPAEVVEVVVHVHVVYVEQLAPYRGDRLLGLRTRLAGTLGPRRVAGVEPEERLAVGLAVGRERDV